MRSQKDGWNQGRACRWLKSGLAVQQMRDTPMPQAPEFHLTLETEETMNQMKRPTHFKFLLKSCGARRGRGRGEHRAALTA